MIIQDTATFRALQASVQTVLEHPDGREWTVQGFGMLRTYFDSDKKFRLNVWDYELAVPGVSIIHTHPWHFTSWIIVGLTCNVRYQDVMQIPGSGIIPNRPLANGDHGLYNVAPIHCGIDGDNTARTENHALLKRLEQEFYEQGHTYRQTAEEIHASFYRDGTVTLNDRSRVGDGEHANVYWPHGQEWVDAKPRLATPVELRRTLDKALAKFPKD